MSLVSTVIKKKKNGNSEMMRDNGSRKMVAGLSSTGHMLPLLLHLPQVTSPDGPETETIPILLTSNSLRILLASQLVVIPTNPPLLLGSPLGNSFLALKDLVLC